MIQRKVSSEDEALAALLEGSLGEYLNPADYLLRVGRASGIEGVFRWQREAMDPLAKRVLMLTCRQAGKSTVVGAKVLCEARYSFDALELITCPAQDQSKELMKKVEMFQSQDPTMPKMIHDGAFEKEYENRSRIVALPGSERSVRGFSKPRKIVVDEAARVADETIYALRPMMIGAGTELLLLTTPFGKRGYFYRMWTGSNSWKKIMVRIGFDVVDGKLVDAMPEAEYHEKMLKLGILAYYSPRHTRAELEEELADNDEMWFRQEYLCEFVDVQSNVFTAELIQSAFDGEVKPLGYELLDADVEPLEVPK